MYLIEVDGGIDTENAAKLIESGVNVLVAGNSVFSSDDPAETIQKVKIPDLISMQELIMLIDIQSFNKSEYFSFLIRIETS